MGIATKAVTAVALVATMVSGAQAQIAVTGKTTGCFYTSGNCTAQNSATAAGITFTGLNFNWASVTSTPQNVTLGTLNWALLSGGTNENFRLTTTITSPPSIPGSQSINADIDGQFLYGFGIGDPGLDFDNSAKQFAVSGGTIFLTINDVDSDRSDNITGKVSFVSDQVSSTPEPSSMALLGTGLVGLVPMVRRRRK